MPRTYQRFYTTQQLNQGIREEMKYGLDRATAERVARRKLAQSPRFYQRIYQLTPTFKQDRRRYRRRAKREEEKRNFNPYNQGSFFK